MALSKDLLHELYQVQKLSIAQIARRLGCSPNKVAYWMGKYGIVRRGISAAIYERRNPHGDPFNIQPLDTVNGRELFQLGIGLYIGEGSKKRVHEVAISNTDPRVVRAFIQFLSDRCGVSRDSLFAEINVFDDVDLEQVKAFWEKVTGLRRSQFHQPVVRPSRGGAYGNRSEHGTIKVGVYNTKLHRLMEQWMDKALQSFE